MNAKNAQKERTHASIIVSACRLVREKGIGGARVADVMSGAGLTVGGFYAHFPSKEALVDEALRRAAAFMRGRLFDRIEEKPLGARREVVLKRYLSAAHRDDPADGYPLPAVVGEVTTTTPEYRDVLAEQLADPFAARRVRVKTRHGARNDRAHVRRNQPRARGEGNGAVRRDPARLSRLREGRAMSSEFEKATALEPIEANVFRGVVPDGWQQGKGAFGGVVIGMLTRAMTASETEQGHSTRPPSPRSSTAGGRRTVPSNPVRAGSPP